jgi:hypothetical protein
MPLLDPFAVFIESTGAPAHVLGAGLQRGRSPDRWPVSEARSTRKRSNGYAFQISMSPTLMSFFVTSTGPIF